MSKPIKTLFDDAVAKQKGPGSSGGTHEIAGDSSFPMVFGVDVGSEPKDLINELAK